MYRKLPLLKFATLLSALSVSLLSAGCSNISLQPGAEKVRVLSTPVAAPQCHLLGQVIGKTVDYFPQDPNKVTDAELTSIKNAATALGANVVVLTQSKANPLLDNKQHVHVVIADAFNCQPPL